MKQLTKMPVDTEFLYWLYKNHLEEWNRLWELSKEYQSEQCNIDDVVGRSEQLVCNCQGCGQDKIIEYCEKCYAENLTDLAN